MDNKEYCWVVEANEGREWVPKMRCNFEDVEQFKIIAKSGFHRILHNDIDVTNNYKEGVTPVKISSPPKQEENKPKPLKPAEFKSMNEEQKLKIVDNIKQQLDNKAYRKEIFENCNISEATYDLVRQYMKTLEEPKQISEQPPKVQNNTQPKPTSKKPIKRGTLLGGR